MMHGRVSRSWPKSKSAGAVTDLRRAGSSSCVSRSEAAALKSLDGGGESSLSNVAEIETDLDGEAVLFRAQGDIDVDSNIALSSEGEIKGEGEIPLSCEFKGEIKGGDERR